MASKNQKKFEFRLGRQGLLFFVISMSVLLFGVFLGGVLVGIHIDAYPEKIAGLPEAVLKGLKFYKPGSDRIARSNEGSKVSLPGNGNIRVASGVDSPPPQGAAAKETAVSLPSVSAPVSSSEKAPPAEMAPGEAAPLPSWGEGRVRGADSFEGPKDSASRKDGKYLVQLGSFRSEKVANQFGRKILSFGYTPRIKIAELPDKGKWHRVVIEGFETKEEAEKAAMALSEKIRGLSYMVRPME